MLMPTLLTLASLFTIALGYVVNDGTSCYLYPDSSTHFGYAVDDVPSIQKAFELCGTNGTVVFSNNSVFYINTVLNTTNLLNCDVELNGELRYSTNIPYWRSHSFDVVLQNQSTAWLFGGTNVTLRAGEGGFYNGSGQAWYTQNRNNSNEPGRPISMTFYNSTNLLVDGLRFIQPQFWATFIWQSQNVTLRNIYVNATSDDEWGTVNTDGGDSWNSDNILIENWIVDNGDDCYAAKGNTTNLHVRNVTCHHSSGMTIGSVGQYPTMPDYVENCTFEDITLINSMDGAYIKTWQGVPSDSTGNGDAGGGGSGYVRNITFRNFNLTNVGLPIQISQCIYTETGGDCDTSKMAISNITWSNFTGTSRYNIAASLFCTSKHPCEGISFEYVNIKSENETLGLPLWNTTVQNEVFQCKNLVAPNGVLCNHEAPSDYGQSVVMNVQ